MNAVENLKKKQLRFWLQIPQICFILLMRCDTMRGRQPTPTRESFIVAGHSSLHPLPSPLSVLITDALFSLVSLLIVSRKVACGLPLVLLSWEVPRGWAHLQWVLGAAHSAQQVSFVSALSCVTVWDDCHTSRYFWHGPPRRHWVPVCTCM